MKTMRFLIFILIVLSSQQLVAQMPTLNIFRNDGKFERLRDGVKLTHAVDAEGNVFVEIEGESVKATTIDSIVVRTRDIPSIYINLKDYPQAGQLWDKELYLDATVSVEGNGYIDDEPAMDVKVKGRGNSSWSFPKKPMRLKFSKKTEFCGFGKAKNFVLLANFVDFTLMHNYAALRAAELLGVDPVNHVMPCDVYFNGSLLGSYMLTEKVGINAQSVDIDETKGMLFELSSEFDEDFKFKSPVYGLPVMVKDPDLKEIAAEAVEDKTAEELFSLWKSDFSKAERETAADVSKAFEYFDLKSFVDYFLINNFACNDEIGHPKSVYLYKESLGEGKYKFGPLWDFDLAFNKSIPKEGNAFQMECEYAPDKPVWVNYLFDDLLRAPEFIEAYKTRFEYFRENAYPQLLKDIDEYSCLLEPSARLNGMLWPEGLSYPDWVYIESSYDAKSAHDRLVAWIEKRVDYMQKEIEAWPYKKQ